MTDLRTAAQQALEAMEWISAQKTGGMIQRKATEPITALKAALAEPPVDDPHRDHWVAIAEAAQKIAASTECGLAEVKALCAALDRLTDAALAEPVQKPVAWMYTGIKSEGSEHGPHLVWRPEYMDAMSASKGAKATPLYTAPPQRKPLSDADLAKIWDDALDQLDQRDQLRFIARAIERAHGITP